MTKTTARISCHKCRHFYVTWDEAFPYGCRAMGFKGKLIPSLLVFQASGKACLSYEAKPGNGRGKEPEKST